MLYSGFGSLVKEVFFAEQSTDSLGVLKKVRDSKAVKDILANETIQKIGKNEVVKMGVEIVAPPALTAEEVREVKKYLALLRKHGPEKIEKRLAKL